MSQSGYQNSVPTCQALLSLDGSAGEQRCQHLTAILVLAMFSVLGREVLAISPLCCGSSMRAIQTHLRFKDLSARLPVPTKSCGKSLNRTKGNLAELQ